MRPALLFYFSLQQHSVIATTFFLLLLSNLSHDLIFQAHASINHEMERNFAQIPLPVGPIGPEAIAFDAAGGGPYTGVSDGRVLKWEAHEQVWVEFATMPQRNKEECDGTVDPMLEDRCGRPLGLRFNMATGDLYITDAYFGLLTVGPNGGLATQLSIQAQGISFGFTNNLDIDQRTGLVYFTDSSTIYQRRDCILSILTGDKTGRLMQYDPKSKRVTVLLDKLFFANGVALSQDNTFLLVAETSKCRILIYWLQGPNSGRHEVFARLPGFPDNINRNPKGEFWVALNKGGYLLASYHSSFSNNIARKTSLTSILKSNAEIKPTLEVGDDINIGGVKLSQEGAIVEVLHVNDTTTAHCVSELKEQNDSLWLGSEMLPFAGVSKL